MALRVFVVRSRKPAHCLSSLKFVKENGKWSKALEREWITTRASSHAIPWQCYVAAKLRLFSRTVSINSPYPRCAFLKVDNNHDQNMNYWMEETHSEEQNELVLLVLHSHIRVIVSCHYQLTTPYLLSTIHFTVRVVLQTATTHIDWARKHLPHNWCLHISEDSLSNKCYVSIDANI